MQIYSSSKAKDFINEKSNRINDDKHTLCRSCKYQRVCSSGCKRMENNMYIDESGEFCGFKDFLDYAINDMAIVWKMISR